MADTTDTATLDDVDFDEAYSEEETDTDDQAELAEGITTPEEEDKKKDIDTPVVDAEEEKDEEDDEDPDAPGSEEEKPLVEELTEMLGYEVEGDFPDTPKGLADYVQAVGGKIAEQQLDGLFEAYPDLEEYAHFRQNGGSPEDFFNMASAEADYTGIESVSETNVALQEQLVRAGLSLQGLEDEDLEDAVEDMRAGGLLHKQAERSLKALQKNQAATKEYLLSTQAERAEVERAEAETFWTNTKKTIVDAESFGGIGIPAKDREDFFAFISTPRQDRGGMSERDYQASQLSLEDRLMVDALLYQTRVKGVSLSNIIEKKAASTDARKLRDRLNRSRAEEASGATPEREKKQGKLDSVNWDALN